MTAYTRTLHAAVYLLIYAVTNSFIFLVLHLIETLLFTLKCAHHFFATLKSDV